MLACAKVRFLRMTPRKVGYVLKPIRRHTVAEALRFLSVMNRRAAMPVAKAVACAFANARLKNPTLREEDVFISKAVANEGPSWKRYRAAAFGRAVPFVKRTTHLIVEIDSRSS